MSHANFADLANLDPNAAAAPGSGIFGLPFTRDQAHLILVPCPFDATTSYGGGASSGPAAILAASHQVDLLDHHFGDVYARGIHMLEIPEAIAEVSRTARSLAEPIIARGGAATTDSDSPSGNASADDDRRTLAKIEDACRICNEYTHDEFTRILRSGKVPGLVGGDHSTPYGAIQACSQHVKHLAEHCDKDAEAGLGILHLDAHFDLRHAFEGFRFSHASIMRNVLDDMPGVSKLVSVGIRDYCREELEYATDHADRVIARYDAELCELVWAGHAWPLLAESIIRDLPACVYVSFDIDVLDPSLCPNTGTPVPGGLNFNQVAVLLLALKRSGKRIIGFDLNEVCPPTPATADEQASEWDANVGARVLYKLCGAAML